jgi:membrane-associated phospholipid phosphatase
MTPSVQDRPWLGSLAEAISLIFHPLVIGIPTLLVAMTQRGSTITQALVWTVITAVVVNIPLIIILASGVRAGRYSDASVSIREQRFGIYLIGIAFLVLFLSILIISHAPRLIIACLISASAASVIGFFINQRTKISLHSMTMAGCATVLLLTYWPAGLFLAVFSPVLGWARIYLKHHTPFQILLGWIVAILSVVLTFLLIL